MRRTSSRNILYSLTIVQARVKIVHSQVKRSSPIPTVTSFFRYSLDRLGRLTISSVKMEDDGTWQCENRDTGVTARPIFLLVLGKLTAIQVDGKLSK